MKEVKGRTRKGSEGKKRVGKCRKIKSREESRKDREGQGKIGKDRGGKNRVEEYREG